MIEVNIPQEISDKLRNVMMGHVFDVITIGVYITKGSNFYHKALEAEVQNILKDFGTSSVSIHLNYSIGICEVTLRLHFPDGGLGNCEFTLHNNVVEVVQ